MDALYEDPDLAGFYDWDNPWPADFDWFLSCVAGAGTVLDLGCGTGVFSVALAARGARVWWGSTRPRRCCGSRKTGPAGAA